MRAAAARAWPGLSATTKAIGWPTWCTSSAAKSGSSSTMAPISLSPGTSTAVNTPHTPLELRAASVSRASSRPWAMGE